MPPEGTQTALLPTEAPVEHPREGVSSPAPSLGKPKPPRRRAGYYHIGDRKYVSVTTVLDGVLVKKNLIPWAAKKAAELALEDPVVWNTPEKCASGIYGVRDRAGDRGGTIHSLIHATFMGGEIDRTGVPDHLKGFAEAFWKWQAMARPRMLHTETTAFSHAGYAGSFDLLAELGDRTALIDFKTSASGVHRTEVTLQLAAYRHCDRMLPSRENNDSVEMPAVDDTVCILLRSDGSFEHHAIPADEEAFAAFRHLLDVWKWLHGEE